MTELSFRSVISKGTGPRHFDYGYRMRLWYQFFPPLLGLILGRELFTGSFPIYLPVEVLEVVDGDTVKVAYRRQVHSIRLAGIDAPEMGQPTMKGADAGLFSKRCLEKLLLNRRWQLEWKGRDIYQRVLGDLHSDSQSINLAMLTAGCASVYPFLFDFTQVEKNKMFQELSLARQKRRGLWGQGGFMRPYHFRKLQKTRRRPLATE